MYTSSIVNNYGDTDNVKKDTRVLNDILSRQGTSLLIDVIAETTGETCNKFKLNSLDRRQLVNTLVDELREALLERV